MHPNIQNLIIKNTPHTESHLKMFFFETDWENNAELWQNVIYTVQ